ncbi:MAG: hypothetical protein WCV88_04430 [Patescibacteria group bacterium]|jgi:hypothetical protein
MGFERKIGAAISVAAALHGEPEAVAGDHPTHAEHLQVHADQEYIKEYIDKYELKTFLDKHEMKPGGIFERDGKALRLAAEAAKVGDKLSEAKQLAILLEDFKLDYIPAVTGRFEELLKEIVMDNPDPQEYSELCLVIDRIISKKTSFEQSRFGVTIVRDLLTGSDSGLDLNDPNGVKAALILTRLYENNDSVSNGFSDISIDDLEEGLGDFFSKSSIQMKGGELKIEPIPDLSGAYHLYMEADRPDLALETARRELDDIITDVSNKLNESNTNVNWFRLEDLRVALRQAHIDHNSAIKKIQPLIDKAEKNSNPEIKQILDEILKQHATEK